MQNPVSEEAESTFGLGLPMHAGRGRCCASVCFWWSSRGGCKSRNALEYPSLAQFESLHDSFILELDGIGIPKYAARGAYTTQFQCSCRCVQTSGTICSHV